MEYRPVDISVELFGEGEQTFIRETRKDTGEIVDTRPASDSEQQLTL